MWNFAQQLLIPPSSPEWMRFVAVVLGICTVIGIGELVRLRFRWSPEFTRKLVHISVAILIFFAPKIFDRALPPIIMAVVFCIVAYVGIRLGLLKSMHAIARGSYGTLYYPLAFLILVILFWNGHPEIVSLSMLALGLGDASAAIVGESIRHPIEFHLTADKKSIQGSSAMFITTLLGLFAGMVYLFDGMVFSSSAMVTALVCSSLIATAWEALSSRGLDNLTIPLSVSFVLYYSFVPTPMQDLIQFETGVGLGLLIAILSFRVRFLTASGSVATFLLASFVFGVGGWKWTIPILSFFVLSSLLSNLGKNRKASLSTVFEKTSTRDFGQVAANGGVAGILVLLQYLFQNLNFYPMFLGAVAAVTADTWGTEIGTFFRGRTVSIVSFKNVEPGTNGGISVAGVCGGILGSVVIVTSALFWMNGFKTMLVVVLGGILGSSIDSLAGATVQARYRCSTCGKSTEKKMHCGEPTDIISGIRWINNDVVNWLCAISGAALAIMVQP
jgi:uncharacterized protein (TIGR00297 family)